MNLFRMKNILTKKYKDIYLFIHLFICYCFGDFILGIFENLFHSQGCAYQDHWFACLLTPVENRGIYKISLVRPFVRLSVTTYLKKLSKDFSDFWYEGLNRHRATFFKKGLIFVKMG